jgi:hypothetical protein
MNLYPERSGGPISEVWQAERWKEYSPEDLTPMYSNGIRQFYINELAELDNGCSVIPQNWYFIKGTLYADCMCVTSALVRLKTTSQGCI